MQTTGVINTSRHSIELYHIKDYKQDCPWYLRLFGLGNMLLTSDNAEDVIILRAIANSKEKIEDIRKHTEICREEKSVFEVCHHATNSWVNTPTFTQSFKSFLKFLADDTGNKTKPSK